MRLVGETIPTKSSVIRSIAETPACSPETFRGWLRRADVDDGLQPGVATDESAGVKPLDMEAPSCAVE